ncbi:MAG: type III secretion system chaperone [Victivallales bacterium]|nr:type III secretion system chaperone [Victivallales bacterium]
MKTKEDYKAFLEEVRKETGIDALVPDETGLVTVNVDETYNVNLQFVEATGNILCFVEVATLPNDAPKAVYRDLMAGGLFGKETAGGYFALEPDTETVVYNYFFDLETIADDVEEFVSALEKILQLCDIWAERIEGILEEGESSENTENHVFFHP